MPQTLLGKKAPQFALKDKDSTLHNLKAIDSEFVVLFFYPKDNTPGCTIEAQNFSKDIAKFNKLGATLIGISGGDEKSKEKFCSKHKLQMTLLSDPDFSVATKYHSFGPKSFMGRKFNGISRNTFILDKSKKIIRVFEKVQPLTHSKEVLEALGEFV